jgi:hypothetical protein
MSLEFGGRRRIRRGRFLGESQIPPPALAPASIGVLSSATRMWRKVSPALAEIDSKESGTELKSGKESKAA